MDRMLNMGNECKERGEGERRGRGTYVDWLRAQGSYLLLEVVEVQVGGVPGWDVPLAEHPLRALLTRTTDQLSSVVLYTEHEMRRTQ